jgi:hypothetical protein
MPQPLVNVNNLIRDGRVQWQTNIEVFAVCVLTDVNAGGDAPEPVGLDAPQTDTRPHATEVLLQ